MKFPIKRGDRSPDVALLQDRLNRLGALLADDGAFGGGTETAVLAARAHLGLPAGTDADAALWAKLDALPEPSALLPTRGLTFIAREEVGSRAAYDRKYLNPCWPGGESGITIGIGYDLRFASPARFAADWQAHLPAETMAALLPWLGRTGSAEGAAALAGRVQPFEHAWAVFIERTIPETVQETRQAFPGYDPLPALCRSALASLVYNRGPGMQGDRRAEMREIRSLIAAGKLDRVAEQFSAMKHLWPEGNGLRDRRDREARLWNQGLEQIAFNRDQVGA